jgi:flagellar biosynthesis protein FlhF
LREFAGGRPQGGTKTPAKPVEPRRSGVSGRGFDSRRLHCAKNRKIFSSNQMIIRKVFPTKDILEIQEELKRIYGNNFVVIEINHIKKKLLPFIPLFGKEYTEVILEIPDKTTEEEATVLQNEKNIEKNLLESLEALKKELLALKEEIKKEPKAKKTIIKVEEKASNLAEEDKKFLSQLGDEALGLLDVLTEKGFSENLVIKILKEATGYDIDNAVFDLKDTPLKALTEAFGKLFEFKSLESEEPKKVIVLIGPTGVGKTTTIAKIISNFVLNNQRKVGGISLDTFRVGGAQRLESFLKVLEVPFRKADTKKAFEVALEEFSDKEYIFVDVAGRSAYDELSWKELFNILSIIDKEHLIPLLTVSFNMHPDVVMEIYEHLKGYPIKGLILTKADETYKRGTIFNAVEKMKLPLFYFTNGQKVPHNLLPATPLNMAKLILE